MSAQPAARARVGACAVVVLALLASAPARAQSGETGEALIKKVGASAAIPNQGFPAPKELGYKISWDITEGPAKPDSIVTGFARPANFLVMTDEAGVPRRNVHLALIVHGSATTSLLANDAYRAITGADNASIPLLQALHHAGVQIILCGQAMMNRKIPRDQLLPFVKVAKSATMARAILHAQGYANFAP